MTGPTRTPSRTRRRLRTVIAMLTCLASIGVSVGAGITTAAAAPSMNGVMTDPVDSASNTITISRLDVPGNGAGYAAGNAAAYTPSSATAYTSGGATRYAPSGATSYTTGNRAGNSAGNDGTQDLTVLQNAAEAFLIQQTDGLPGRVTIALTPSTARGLNACSALEPFLPPGVRLWGRAMIGVRCNSERPWTIYLQARIGVIGDYYVAARTLNAGDSIGMGDLAMQHGDLTALPGAIITNPSQVVGAVVMNRVTAGMPLRSDLIKAALTIRYGQQVKVIANGSGFSVQAEGSALANAAPGQTVRVRTGSGVIISGIARADASVDVPL